METHLPEFLITQKTLKTSKFDNILCQTYCLKVIVFCFFALFINWLNCQEQKTQTLTITKTDSVYHVKELFSSYIDDNRKLNFEDVKNLKFTNKKHSFKLPNKFYWYKLRINPEVIAEKLMISTVWSDEAELFVPFKAGYKRFTTGVLTKRKRPIRNDIIEASDIYIPVDSINFFKPFFLQKRVISIDGSASLDLGLQVMLTNSESVLLSMNMLSSQTKRMIFYGSLFFMAFILFLTSYIVTGDRNFFNYSFYILWVSLINAPNIPMVYNILNEWEPTLYHLVRKVSTVAASASYFYFAVIILNLKEKLPKLFKICQYIIAGIGLFLMLYLTVFLFDPYNGYTIIAYKIFRYAFGIISIVVFILISFKIKRNWFDFFVLFGSFVLILGNIIAVLTLKTEYFWNTVLIEILIFWSLVNFNHKQNLKKNIQIQLNLENEQRLKDNLIQLDNAKSNFFANISHELRTPLTLIKGPLEEQLEQDDLSAMEKQNLSIAKNNTERLETLVNQLLDLSKLESGFYSLHVFQGKLSSFLKSLSESFSYQAQQKKQFLEVAISIDEENYWYDPDVLQKIVTNLLGNALKYSPEEATISFQATVEAGRLAMSLKNTDVSLSKAELAQIFNRFHRSNTHETGTGIGLALTKELVELHKGLIKTESDSNSVSFLVELPVSESAFEASEKTISVANKKSEEVMVTHAVPSEEIISTESTLNGEKPILLIVDDNADVRTYVFSLFDASFHIITAENGKTGFKSALEQVPDLIITDLMMPEDDGLKLTENCKTHDATSHIPIIMLTAKAGDENRLEGLEIGADAYLTKPFNNKILKQTVTNLLESRKKLQERFSKEVILTPKEISIGSYDERFLNALQDVLDNQLVESDFNAEAFAKALGMSRMQLHRKLKALTGQTATEFIRSQRLKLAADLLKKSDANVSEIGYTVGFNNHSHFTKCFKEQFGVAPSEYTAS